VAKVWVQLLQSKQISVAGDGRNKHPGDWVQVGKYLARQWIEEGAATTPESGLKATVGGPGEIGILVNGDRHAANKILEKMSGKISAGYGLPECRWPKTVIWNPDALLRMNLIPVGEELLNTWELAMPLVDYETLAIHLGSTEDRSRTQALIRDLRVPVPDIRLIYMRKCENVERLLAQWYLEKEDSTDDRLAFLRALYQVKPFWLALPVTWTGVFKEEDMH
jgi:hypothetical protein